VSDGGRWVGERREHEHVVVEGMDHMGARGELGDFRPDVVLS
jgi:hypothetical protein